METKGQPFEYRYDYRAGGGWIIYLHGAELTRCMNEQEAQKYCDRENRAAAAQSLDSKEEE